MVAAELSRGLVVEVEARRPAVPRRQRPKSSHPSDISPNLTPKRAELQATQEGRIQKKIESGRSYKTSFTASVAARLVSLPALEPTYTFRAEKNLCRG